MRSLLTVPFLLLLVLSAQAGQPFGEPFILGVGESTQIGDAELSVGFDAITGDSRCPTGVWCFWEGDAAAGLWLALPGEPAQAFVLHTFADFEQMLELGAYVISLQLVTPYPVVNVPIDPATYEVTLVVERAAVPTGERTWGTLKAQYR